MRNVKEFGEFYTDFTRVSDSSSYPLVHLSSGSENHEESGYSQNHGESGDENHEDREGREDRQSENHADREKED